METPVHVTECKKPFGKGHSMMLWKRQNWGQQIRGWGGVSRGVQDCRAVKLHCDITVVGTCHHMFVHIHRT